MLHMIYYRILSIIKEKNDIFWVLFFPIILGTCFNAAFSKIYDMDIQFEKVPVAAVVSDETTLKYTLDALEDEELLNVVYANEEKAKKLLEKNEVEGIITEDEKIHLTVSENGMNATFLQAILDEYVQTMDIIGHIDTKDPAAILKVVSAVQSETSYIIWKNISDGEMNPYMEYFYALIAMACLYACFLGMSCSRQMKADLSPLGMRKCLAPVNRMKLIICDVIGSYMIQCIANLFLIFYLQFILQIDFGNNLPFVLLTAFAGSLIGLSLGTFIGSIPRISEGAKTGICLTVSMVCCFFSGLMIGDIRWKIEDTCPILNRINPAAVISDALYSLNIYDTFERYGRNLLLLVIMSCILCIGSFLMIRRETYEQL